MTTGASSLSGKTRDRDKTHPMCMLYSVTSIAMWNSSKSESRATFSNVPFQNVCVHVLFCCCCCCVFFFVVLKKGWGGTGGEEDSEEAIHLLCSPVWQMHTGLLLLCVFHCSHPIEQHATYCYKYTASDVRTDLLCPLEREQRKSQFNPIMTISNSSYLKIAQINN